MFVSLTNILLQISFVKARVRRTWFRQRERERERERESESERVRERFCC